MSDSETESLAKVQGMPSSKSTLRPPPALIIISRSPPGLGGQIQTPQYLGAGWTKDSGGANNNNNNISSTQSPVGTQRSKFALVNEIPDDQIEDLDVVIPKDQRGTEVSKHYNAIM